MGKWGKRRKPYNGSGYSHHRKETRPEYYKIYDSFRKIVRKRDKQTCQMPGCGCKKKLQVHHILRWADAPHLRYEERNGILLCKDCHDLIKNKEHFYIEMFTRIVEQKYQK
jgi:5-methylcytosine-specific restriction endonuclease McrA